jgi:PAS domain S-box-containing protein
VVSTGLFDPAAFGAAEDAVVFIGNVLESSTEYSIIATDPQGKIVLWNEGARRLYGYPPAEIVGQSWTVLLTEEDVRAGLSQKMTDDALRQDKWEGTVERVRKDGSRFTAHVVTTPRWRANGEPAGFLLISSDITERVRRARVEQELRDANVQLEGASRAKDRFLASMSHELRTPLNAVLGFTGTLLMELPGPLNEEQTKQLTTVQTSGRHLLSLINDLLDLARIESGKFEVQVETVDCQEILEEVALGLRPLAEAKGIGFDVDAPGEPLAIETDRRALSQILINLANNAIKFTDEGAIHLTLTHPSDVAGSVTRFSVIDTGYGIQPDDQESLFAAFERVGTPGSRPYEGTGLGLYICQTLATLIGASITFQSEFGRGSTFMLDVRD